MNSERFQNQTCKRNLSEIFPVNPDLKKSNKERKIDRDSKKRGRDQRIERRIVERAFSWRRRVILWRNGI